MTDPPDYTSVLMRLLAEEQRMLGLFHTLLPHIGHELGVEFDESKNTIDLCCRTCNTPVLHTQGEYADVREEMPIPTPD